MDSFSIYVDYLLVGIYPRIVALCRYSAANILASNGKSRGSSNEHRAGKGKNTRNYNSRYTRYQRQRSIGPRVSLEFRDDLRCTIDRSFPPGCLFVIECACFIHSFCEKTRRYRTGDYRGERCTSRVIHYSREVDVGEGSRLNDEVRHARLLSQRELLSKPEKFFLFLIRPSLSTVFLRKTHCENVWGRLVNSYREKGNVR